MIQYAVTGLILVISVIYLIYRLKTTGKDCDSSKCASCGYFQKCSKEIKKDRP